MLLEEVCKRASSKGGPVRWIMIFLLVSCAPSQALAARPLSVYEVRGMIDKVKIAAFLHKEVPRETNQYVHILDIGSGEGHFLKRIRGYFETMGYKAFVTGIDDGSLFGDRGRDMVALWSTEAKSKNVRFLYLNSKDLPKLVETYDFIFLNAPYRIDGQIKHTIEDGLKVLREDGLFFVRLYEADQIRYFEDQIENTKGVEIIVLQTEMPRGDYELTTKTYVLKKTPFKSDKTTLGQSLGKMFEDLYKQNELKRSA